MKFIGLGANLPSPTYGSPKNTLETAITQLCNWQIELIRVSSWYKSEPIPASSQPWYINAVAEVESTLSPHNLISNLLKMEREFGRSRTHTNEPRTIDLDLLVYDNIVIEGTIIDDIKAYVPHPRMNERAFVLIPLHELSPNWKHPESGVTIAKLIRNLAKNQIIRPIQKIQTKAP